MSRWMMSLDESGTFDEEKQYFVVAGIIYKEEDFESVKDYFVPLVNKLCEIVEEDELHAKSMGAKKRRFCKDVLFSHIGYFDKVKPIVYIIDKNNTIMINQYNQKSWKYNKVLEFLYLDLIENNIIDNNDEIAILIDNIELSESEENNLYSWLPSQHKNVIAVVKGDSKNFKFIQMADMIANSFSKDGKCQIDSYDNQILDPFLEVFPRRFRNEYIKTKDE